MGTSDRQFDFHGLVQYACQSAGLRCDPTRSKDLALETNDNEEYRLHFLAIATGISPRLAHEAFLKELFRSNGETFNTGVLQSPPNEITSLFPSSQLVEPFLAVADSAIEAFGNDDDFWNDVLEIASNASRATDRGSKEPPDVSTKRGQRKAIEEYLETLLH